MQVINVLDDADDMIVPLRALTAGPDPLVVVRAQWLLDLVEYLQAQGLEPAVCAMLLPSEGLLVYPTRTDPRSVWIDVELPEQDPAHRLSAPRYSWRVQHRGRGTLRTGAVNEPAEVERAIKRAFGWPDR